MDSAILNKIDKTVLKKKLQKRAAMIDDLRKNFPGEIPTECPVKNFMVGGVWLPFGEIEGIYRDIKSQFPVSA